LYNGHGFGRSLLFLIDIIGEKIRLWANYSWSHSGAYGKLENLTIGRARRPFSVIMIVRRA
jgi:hypothetical protein